MAKKIKDFETIKKEFIEKGKKQGELAQEEIVDALSKLDISSDVIDDFYEELNREDIILINANHQDAEEEEIDLGLWIAFCGGKIKGGEQRDYF